MKRLIVLAVAILSIAVACGDKRAPTAFPEGASDIGTPATSPEPIDTATESDAIDLPTDTPTEELAEFAEGSTVSASLAPKTAQITIAGETHVFSMDRTCSAVSGNIDGIGVTDDGMIVLEIALRSGDWESTDSGPPMLRIDDNRVDESDPSIWQPSWRAGVGVVESFVGVPETVAVDSYQVEGNTGYGAATAIDINALQRGLATNDVPDPQRATFAINCG